MLNTAKLRFWCEIDNKNLPGQSQRMYPKNDGTELCPTRGCNPVINGREKTQERFSHEEIV
jgi:hypothetical protein